jgi:glycosyltransferase involved in cell wall biosynthesis
VSDRQPIRVVFLNCGFLGHRAVAQLMKLTARLMPGVDATHINLSDDLTLADRVIRLAFSLQLAPQTGAAANLDLRRWRQELNIGLLAARRLAAAARRGPFDVLHFHTQAAAYASIGRMKRTPAIVSIDTTQHLASQEAESALSRRTYRANIVHDHHVFAAAKAITVTSEWAARDLVAIEPACADKVHVMPYPVNLGAFDRAWLDERCGRAADPAYRPRALFVGGDFRRKGGFELLEAWRAGRFGDRATLDVVTDFPLDAERLPAGVRLRPRVVPYTEQWADAWRGADFFVMPTRHEAFGMVYQEAAAAGLPAIATAINAIPELVEHGVTGQLVPPGNGEALASAIDTLVQSAELRHRMGHAARSRIDRVGAPSTYAMKLDSIISSVALHRELQPA